MPTLTAISPIIHSAGSTGNVSLAKRQDLITSDGIRTQVPFVSGNAVRGVLRRVGAISMWDMLGRPELSHVSAAAITSGGSLVKTTSKFTTSDVHEFRHVAPHVGLFGCSGGGVIMPGGVNVGMLRLRCAERNNSQVAARKQLTMLEGVRIAVLPDPLDQYIDADEPSNQMIYTHEAIVEGAVFDWDFQLAAANSEQINDWWWWCLGNWVATGAHLGGRSSVGHGRIEFDRDTLGQIETNTRAAEHRLREWHDANREDILRWLSRL